MSEPNGKTYTLRTLRDFWALGDADRIERAFKEISLGMAQAMRMQDLLNATAEALAAKDGKTCGKLEYDFGESIDWTDDGGKSIDFRFMLGDKQFLRMEHVLSDTFHSGPNAGINRSREAASG